MSRTYTDVNGTEYTDADIERWAQEHDAGYAGAHGPVTKGRPVSVGQEAKPVTIRLDAARRAKLKAVARDRHINTSQLVRDLIDAL